MVLMVFLKESCSGPISHSGLTNDTSMWFSQKQQEQQQQKKNNNNLFWSVGPTDGIL